MAEAGASGEPDGELVTPEVSAELVATLVEMGFSHNRATRALYHTGTDTAEVAVNWATEHAEDADADEPLLIPKNKIVRPLASAADALLCPCADVAAAQKPKLSKEEARAQAEALRRHAALPFH
jgi:hypothetical protein